MLGLDDRGRLDKNMMRAYEEIIDFIAAVANLRPHQRSRNGRSAL